MTPIEIARECGGESYTSVEHGRYTEFSDAALAAFVERIKTEERADYDRKIVLQQSSYEREIATEIGIQSDERRKLAVLASFAHEVRMGAYQDIDAAAKKALERCGLLSLEDVVALSDGARNDHAPGK